MKALFNSRITSAYACLFLLAGVAVTSAQSPANCTEISNDVRVAVEKDPSKVLMVVEDALVINEGCAGDIVKTAIIASKADAALAGQIVQTGVTVAPKMAGVINDAASSVVPGLVATAPAGQVERPVMMLDKNPGKNPIGIDKNPIIDKNPVIPAKAEPDFFIPSSIRGVFLIIPPVSGPLPPRIITNPVSPSNAIP